MSWEPKSYSLNVFLSWIETGELVIPKFQRSLVWDDDKKIKLLDTVKKNLPFGSITMHKHNNKKYIIDGLQRVTTLLSFYGNQNKMINEDSIKDLINNVKNNNIYKKVIINYSDEQIIEISNEMNKHDLLNSNIGNFQEQIANVCNELTYTDLNELKNIASEFRDQHKQLREIKVPSIDFTGSEDESAELFSRINEQGMKLTEIEKLSTKWTKYKFNYNDSNFNKIVKGKFSQLVEFNLKTDDDSIYPTEVIYYIMHRVFSAGNFEFSNKFYDKKSLMGVAHMQEFLLFLRSTLYNSNPINSIDVGEALHKKFDTIEKLNAYIDKVEETLRVLNDKAVILSMNGSVPKKHLSNLSTGSTMISTYMAYIYRKINFDDVKPPKIMNLDPHVLGDIIQGTFSSSSSESGIKNIVDKKYDNEVEFEELWTWYKNAYNGYKHDSPHKINFDLKARALMYFLYSRLLVSVSLKSLSYHLDHIIPKKELREKEIYGVRNFANLAFLEEGKNKSKGVKYDKKYIKNDLVTCDSKEVINAYVKFSKTKKPDDYHLFCDARLNAIEEKLKNNYNLNE